MATCSGMNLTMGLTRYLSLPPGVRARFDGWLRAEHLMERQVIELTLGEGAVTIERYVADEAGNLLVDGDEVVRVIETVAVMTLPPQEAFETRG